MKRIIILLILVMAFLVPALSACGYFSYSGSHGLSFEKIDGKEEYRVVSFSEEDATAVIPAEYKGLPVTEIGGSAFLGRRSLTAVILPDGIKSIGKYAFRDCVKLESITIPDSVTKIGEQAFYGCSSLKTVEIPEGVTLIEDFLFCDCKSLQSVVIPSGVTGIEEAAFRGCINLTSITIPSRVMGIFQQAFDDCYKLLEVYNLSSLDITAGSDRHGRVGYYAKCVNTSMDVPSKLFTDENGCIVYADEKEKMLVGYTGKQAEPVLPGDITEIFPYAFYECSILTKINIPASVKAIGSSAFSGCDNLREVTFAEHSLCTSIGDDAFSDCGSLTGIVLPSAIETIGSGLFSNCDSLTKVTIPAGVTGIYGSAFYECTSLGDLYFAGTRAQWNEIYKADLWNYGATNMIVHCSDDP